MFRKVSYLTAFIALATAVVFSPQIIEQLKKIPVLGDLIEKNA